uniref:Uncharacterized protein n=1 Tax=Alexandrium catenella TaxID=2925 RepID=A0A7S1WH68_ALECA
MAARAACAAPRLLQRQLWRASGLAQGACSRHCSSEGAAAAASSAGIKPDSVLLATAEQIPGYTIKEYKGMAMGSTVRTRDVTKDLTSAIRAVFGGELPHYTQLMAETRAEAIGRMQEHAASLGANGVVALRLTSTNIAASASEVMAYGTAVRVE